MLYIECIPYYSSIYVYYLYLIQIEFYPVPIDLSRWFLEEFFGSKMTFKRHVPQIIKKCERFRKYLGKTRWGSHPSTCLSISHFDQAGMVYMEVSAKPSKETR